MRKDKINYYLDIAQAVTQRSTCLRRHYGCIIVKNDEIIATGYNGAPRGRKNCDELGYCYREKMQIPRGERYELCRSVHAEQNAIISSARKDLIGATIFMCGINAKTAEVEPNSTSCMMCKRVVINAGIKEVIVREPNNKYTIYNVEDWINDDDSLNGKMGYYDCIAIMSYYTVCKAVTSFREIEEMEENLILPIFRRLRFVDCNKPFWRKLMYRAFVRAKTGCDKWHDYEMTVAPYDKDDPIYYEFTSCPAAEFAIRHGLTDIMPALCNVDYASMELLHAGLGGTTTCVDGCRCDYTICGDKDPYLKEHPEYRDEAGFRRNK